MIPGLIVPDFDEDLHAFTFRGHKCAHVTGVLQAAGVGFKSEENGFEIDDGVLEAARDRGTNGDLAVTLWENGILDPDSLDEDSEDALNKYIAWKDSSGYVPELIQQPLYSDRFDVCGIPDSVGWIGEEFAVIDIKMSSGGLKPWHTLQLAFYASMVCKARIPERYVLDLKLKKAKLRKVESDVVSDWTVCAAARTISLWRETNEC
jgi:hypothetical protein